MTHCFFSQGLSWFFQQPPDRLVRDVRDDPQLDHPVGQQLHRPAEPPFRGLRAGQRDHERLLFRGELRSRTRPWTLPERSVQPLLDEPSSGPLDRRHADVQGSRDLLVDPLLRGQQQGLRPPHHPRHGRALPGQLTQPLSLLVRQPDPIPLRHAPCLHERLGSWLLASHHVQHGRALAGRPGGRGIPGPRGLPGPPGAVPPAGGSAAPRSPRAGGPRERGARKPALREPEAGVPSDNACDQQALCVVSRPMIAAST